MIEWLYTGQVKLDVAQLEDALKLCKQCKLTEFGEEIQAAFTKADSFVSTKRGAKIGHVQIESSQSENHLQEDLSVLAMLTLPQEFQFQWHYWTELPLRPRPPACDQYADVAFKVQSHFFHCHKAMFCTRSDYFRALILDHFHEGSWDSLLQMPVIEIQNVSPSAFTVVVNHVYSNLQRVLFMPIKSYFSYALIFQLSPDNVYDVLEVAEMFFLHDLKRQCGSFLSNYIEVENAVDLLQTARLFNIPRLEHNCVEFMASAIEEVSL